MIDEPPPPVRDVVDVYVARSVDHTPLLRMLDEDERRRCARLRQAEDRDRFASAHALARLALAARTGIPTERQRFRRRCVVCGGPHGTPLLVLDDGAGPSRPVPHLNISSRGDHVIVAVRTGGPVGVDVEYTEGVATEGFLDTALTAEERLEWAGRPHGVRDREAAVWWTRKEAILKATGYGLLVEPTLVRVSTPWSPPDLLDWRHPDIPRPHVSLTDLDVRDAEVVAAVAVLGEPTPPVIREADLQDLPRA
ncbi:4'-phosphopantetheinyl transferase family protein [Mobilicoccus pelagius]|uniref:Putative phosphopantetheinyl transferase n=1 Tax=Mobilicoccus pelagius NBRC 104925 TaxID=1089455 RepID=H5UVA8_9MICO|nr:4'-phosphopantetheinyl transferase superfamily protein [Mobilicoccus pelagius]GAB49666.1 putative phosphopantetheinyl transferase [Mobilicoccus pelagius NBRC 104925]